MSYTPTNWQNNPNGNTEINAQRLNNMETGILQAQPENLWAEMRNWLAMDKRANLVMTTTYQTIGEIISSFKSSGQEWFEIGFSVTSLYKTTRYSEYFQYSQDGGTTWHELRREPKDRSDAKAFFYAYPEQFPAGPIHVIIQARKEDSADDMIIAYADTWIKRIG